MTRRTLVSSLAVAAALKAAKPVHPEWKPMLGVLGPYTPNNVAWTKAQGFTNMILGSGPGKNNTLNAETITDAEIAEVKATLQKNQMHVSALQVGGDSINPDPDQRARANHYFVKAIELAGKLGVPYIGTQSGKDAAKPFQQQVDEIVRVYNEQFFPRLSAIQGPHLVGALSGSSQHRHQSGGLRGALQSLRQFTLRGVAI